MSGGLTVPRRNFDEPTRRPHTVEPKIAVPLGVAVISLFTVFIVGLVAGAAGGYFLSRPRVAANAPTTTAPAAQVQLQGDVPAVVAPVVPQPPPVVPEKAAEKKPAEPPPPPKKTFPTDMSKFRATVTGLTKKDVLDLCGTPDATDDAAIGAGWAGPALVYNGPFTGDGGFKRGKAVLYFKSGGLGATRVPITRAGRPPASGDGGTAVVAHVDFTD